MRCMSEDVFLTSAGFEEGRESASDKTTDREAAGGYFLVSEREPNRGKANSVRTIRATLDGLARSDYRAKTDKQGTR